MSKNRKKSCMGQNPICFNKKYHCPNLIIPFNWAVLIVSKDQWIFPKDNMLAICPFVDIEATADEPDYKIYHCPCEYYNTEMLSSLEAVAMNWTKRCSFHESRGLMCIHGIIERFVWRLCYRQKR